MEEAKTPTKALYQSTGVKTKSKYNPQNMLSSIEPASYLEEVLWSLRAGVFYEMDNALQSLTVFW